MGRRKKEEAVPAEQVSSTDGHVNLEGFPYRDGFPTNNDDTALRTVYFERLGPLDKEAMKQRGYQAVSLFELPRADPKSEQQYLLAKAQAMEEGTVPATRDRLEALKLEMQANKMLSARGEPMDREVKNDERKEILENLKNWGKSQHTLHGNTTALAASREKN